MKSIDKIVGVYKVKIVKIHEQINLTTNKTVCFGYSYVSSVSSASVFATEAS